MATLVRKSRSTAGFKMPRGKRDAKERTESPYEVWNNQLAVPISLAILVRSHALTSQGCNQKWIAEQRGTSIAMNLAA